MVQSGLLSLIIYQHAPSPPNTHTSIALYPTPSLHTSILFVRSFISSVNLLFCAAADASRTWFGLSVKQRGLALLISHSFTPTRSSGFFNQCTPPVSQCLPCCSLRCSAAVLTSHLISTSGSHFLPLLPFNTIFFFVSSLFFPLP